MKAIIFFIGCLMLIDLVAGSRSGYPVTQKGCVYSCFWGSNWWCNAECTALGGSSGYCAWPSCWCYSLPDNRNIWGSYPNNCGKK
uniref:Toxin To5 n=1 Tax=Tityus obscurus TaxID=1221240 RepID=SCX5_TITOB|nr:RecName: Full=Toxin To5; AltName: Full=PT-Arthr*-beta* NaTx2.7; AltName: Full=Toxin Tc66; AltName: Full=Toxin To66; Flags: Precursor [Tityus obscurus]CCD31422.1 scorpion toxin To5 precursor [Tityus obscurus]